jgi:hypothetical protein
MHHVNQVQGCFILYGNGGYVFQYGFVNGEQSMATSIFLYNCISASQDSGIKKIDVQHDYQRRDYHGRGKLGPAASEYTMIPGPGTGVPAEQE